MSTNSNKPRLLCLHGACSNDDITMYQTAGLALQERFDCIYLHAPHIARPFPGLEKLSDGPFYAWSDPTTRVSLADQEDMWDASLDYIANYFKSRGDTDDGDGPQPFEGVFAFSQGAAIITNFSHPNVWKEKFKLAMCPWKFVVLACGAGGQRNTVSRDSALVDLPSFHIFGKNDRMLMDSKLIAEYWEPTCRTTHTHGRGHEIDMQIHTREKELMKKLNNFFDEHCCTTKKKGWGIQGLPMPEFYLCGKTFGGSSTRSDS